MTRLQNDLLCVKWVVEPYSLTYLLPFWLHRLCQCTLMQKNVHCVVSQTVVTDPTVDCQILTYLVTDHSRIKIHFQTRKTVAFLAPRARSRMQNVAMYLHSGGQIITGTHISDTNTMHQEVYYIHPQSGRMLFVDTVRLASGGCPAVCSSKNSVDKRTYIDRQIDRYETLWDRISENNGCLAAVASQWSLAKSAGINEYS